MSVMSSRALRTLVVGVVLALTSAVAPAPAASASTPDELALATLDHIVAGDFVAAAAPFDPTLQKRLPPNALGQAWGTYQQLQGGYLSHGDPQDTPRGDLTVVNVPLQMAKQPGQFRLSVHGDGTVSGLYFLKEGVPVP